MAQSFKVVYPKRVLEAFRHLYQKADSVDLVEAYVAGGFGIGLSVIVPNGRLAPNVRALPLPDFGPVIMGALWRGKTSALLQSFLDEMQLRAKEIRNLERNPKAEGRNAEKNPKAEGRNPK